jgi:hypothetical protein
MGGSRWRALGVVAMAAALGIAAVAPSSAQTTPTGTGTSSGSTSILQATLGTGSLAVRLLGEDSLTTNVVGATRATERLSPLQITSTLLPALDGISMPASETTSTGGENTTATPPVDLSTLVSGSPIPGLLTGTLDPAALRALVDATGATGTADAAIRDLSVLAGLLSLDAATADLGSTALVGDAAAVRGLVIDHLEVLDLTALLEALGLSLGDLPLDVILGLLDQLGLPLPVGIDSLAELTSTLEGLLDDTSVVRTQVAALQAQIEGLEDDLATAEAALATVNAQIATLTTQIAEQNALLAACGGVPLVCDPITALIATLTGQLTTAQGEAVTLTGTIATINAQIDDLLDQIDTLLDGIAALVDELTGLLDGVLDVLDGAPLVTLEDLVVGVTAKADDTVASSVATVIASIGDIKVGSTSVGGLPTDAVLAQVTALADQVTATLGTVLGTIAPALAGVVDLDLLERTTSVVQEGTGTRATAGLTALRATVTPPDVCAVLQDIVDLPETVGDVLTGLGVEPPALPGPVGDVLGTIGSTVTCELVLPNEPGLLPAALDADGVAAALTQPLRVEAVSVAGTAFYALPTPATPTAPTTPQGSLPRTGGDAAWAVLAAALGVAGLAGRRLLRRTAPTT